MNRSCSLTLHFLSINKKGTTSAERHCIKETAVELNQPMYYKDVLTSEWKLENVWCWGADLFTFPQDTKGVDSNKTNKTRSWAGEVFWKLGHWPRKSTEFLTSHWLPLSAKKAWTRNVQFLTTDRPMSQNILLLYVENLNVTKCKILNRYWVWQMQLYVCWGNVVWVPPSSP